MPDRDKSYKSLILNVLHTIFCIIVFILSILVFLDTQDNKVFFPIIFINIVIISILQLARIFNGLSVYRYKKLATYTFILLSVFFTVLSIMALISL